MTVQNKASLILRPTSRKHLSLWEWEINSYCAKPLESRCLSQMDVNLNYGDILLAAQDSSQNKSPVSKNLMMMPMEKNRKYSYFPSRDHCPVPTVLTKDFLFIPDNLFINSFHVYLSSPYYGLFIIRNASLPCEALTLGPEQSIQPVATVPGMGMWAYIGEISTTGILRTWYNIFFLNDD